MAYFEHINQINTIILDVDGVLTDSSLYCMENGHLVRKMSTRDGYAIQHALKNNLRIIIITGGSSSGVVKRLQGLGIKEIFSGVSNKIEVFNELVDIYDLDPSRTAYMGDDIPDYECMRMVALAACPQNASPEIIEISRFISSQNGGQGCVRELIESIMKVQGTWKPA